MAPNFCPLRVWLPPKAKLIEISIVLLMSLGLTIVHNHTTETRIFRLDSMKLFVAYLVLFCNMMNILARLMISMLGALISELIPQRNETVRHREKKKIKKKKENKRIANISDNKSSWCKVNLPPRPTFKTHCVPTAQRRKDFAQSVVTSFSS